MSIKMVKSLHPVYREVNPTLKKVGQMG